MHVTTNQGPAVQSIVSLTSSLAVKRLTALVSTISNSQVFFWKNVSSFCKCKSYSHFFSKNISVYAIFNDQSFNHTLTNDIVSFELDSDKQCDQSSLSAWRNFTSLAIQKKPSEDSDQTVNTQNNLNLHWPDMSISTTMLQLMWFIYGAGEYHFQNMTKLLYIAGQSEWRRIPEKL